MADVYIKREDGRNRIKYDKASENAYPTACFVVGRKTVRSASAAARQLAEYLTNRVMYKLHTCTDKDKYMNRYTSEGRAVYNRLYDRALPRCRQYVAKYLR